MFEKTVEAILREALERGDFDDLPGKGKPIDLRAYFDTPEEVRVAYSLLKNAHLLPQEVALLREIAALKEARAACHNPEAAAKLDKTLSDRLLAYNLLRERKKSIS
jgi:hypothetical protein